MLGGMLLTTTASCLLQGSVYAAAIQEYMFQENTTYPVYTAQGVVTRIELDSRGKIKGFGAGLSSGWDLVRRGNVFYLRPKADAVDTNLIARTQAHQYIFEFEVLKNVVGSLSEISDEGVNHQVKFRYSDPTDFSLRASTLANYSLKYDSSKIYNTNYDMAVNEKSRWLVPLKVYNDGRFTYIYLNEDKSTGDFPAAYGGKSEKGAKFVLNSDVEGNVVIVHGTYPFLVLRHGNDVIGLEGN